MSRPPPLTFLPAEVPPGWTVGPSPFFSQRSPDTAASIASTVPGLPPAPALPRPPSRAIVNYGQLAPPPSGYISLPRNYTSEQRFYPYVRNPYNVSSQLSQHIRHNHHSTHPSTAIMSKTSTWRASAAYQDIPPPPSSSNPAPPSPPFLAITRQGTEFTVYHVCRVCRHPRSIKYHRNHPVYPGATVPEPGICHRCSEHHDESSEEEIVEKQKPTRRRHRHSKPSHGGSDGEPRGRTKRSKSKPRRARSRLRKQSEKKITVYVTDDGATSSSEDSQVDKIIESKSDPASSRITYRHLKPDDVQASKKSTKSSKIPSQAKSGSVRPLSPRSAIAQRQADLKSLRQSSVMEELAIALPDRTQQRAPTDVRDYEVRKIAREEVERYRQAERRIDAHSQAYAHGTLVPAADLALPPVVIPSTPVQLEPEPTKLATSFTRRNQVKQEVAAEGSQRTLIARSRTEQERFIAPASRVSDQDILPQSTQQAANSSHTMDKQDRYSRSQLRSKVSSTSREQRDRTRVPSVTQQAQREYSEFYDEDFIIRKPPTIPGSYVRRGSFDVQSSIRPGSSVSQRTVRPRSPLPEEPTPYEISGEKDMEHRAIVRSLDSKGQNPLVSILKETPKASFQERMPSVTTFQDDHNPLSWTRRRSTAAQAALEKDSVYRRGTRDLMTDHEMRPSTNSRSPPQRRRQSTPEQERDQDLQRVQRGKRDNEAEMTQRPPSPPPRDQIISEHRRVYRTEMSPYRERFVTERIVRSRRSPQQVNTRPSRPLSPSPTRLPSVRQNERGRSTDRDEESDVPPRRLRSILRSPSVSPWGRDRSGSRPATSRTGEPPSPGQRVSFSEVVDVTTLAPPPSSTTSLPQTQVTGGMSRLREPRTRIRGGTQLDGHHSRSSQGSEKYYYENTRRPDYDRSEQNMSSADTLLDERNKRFARVLSESPSRERLLSMSGERERRMSQNRRSSASGPSQSGTSRGRQSQRASDLQQPSDPHGPYRPLQSPTASMRTFPSQSRTSFATSMPGSSTIDGRGVRKYVNVIGEGRDEGGRYVEVEETVILPPAASRPTTGSDT